MKKIKKKKPAATKMVPAFIIGWTHDDPPPPGFLAAWFDRNYGGPLTVKFLGSSGHLHFDAIHTSWTARIDLSPSDEQVNRWQSSLQWDHTHMGFIGAPSLAGQDRRDAVLHGTRLARGVSLLTEGTTFDLGTGAYLNPSDWRDRDLETFVLEDHVQIEQQERVGEGRMWLHTRGLSKFGWDELETFQAIGLTDQESRHRLLYTAEAVIRENRNLKVGEQIDLPGERYRATAIRHRTDSVYGHPIAFREVSWT
ncbi:MAG: hypothetical protein AB7T38_06560 [Nitrospirales bacterium]